MSTTATVVQIPVKPETVLTELEKQIRGFDFSEPPQTLIGDLIFYSGWLNRLQNHPATPFLKGLIHDLTERPAPNDPDRIAALYGHVLDALQLAKRAKMEGLL
jgi:hypothetical protein